jgi:mannose PTS system EIIA component
MIGILIVSHEPLGTALLHCTRHIFGHLPVQLAALDVVPDEDPDRARQAAADLLARINDGSGVIVLTDLYGATPSRIAERLAEPGRVAVIAGVNLPLLVKALTYRRGPLEEIVATLLAGVRETIARMGDNASEAPGQDPQDGQHRHDGQDGQHRHDGQDGQRGRQGDPPSGQPGQDRADAEPRGGAGDGGGR